MYIQNSSPVHTDEFRREMRESKESISFDSKMGK